ncbi:nuclear transport factor 2 family protein [Vibrio breoganii]|uniref:nuclear transport factor 2 family protein n=1 Tax=Vibrio breoganii TaxID=553239 RepID=UPI000C8481E7|nr:nuclear transport factor 2 family protein [Vibrio breoganii]PMG05534.1 hypothetical protein BCV02_18740 [Vibrio breoganii]PMG91279.1 hypothetical protein BCU79_17475 [Vibrio breoganii]PML82923.1 hypothetical protein BCT67_17880 [Vibrio breoganii]
MKNSKTILSLMLLCSSAGLSSTVFADNTHQQTEVLFAVSENWQQARIANLDGMFATAPETHTYIMGGTALWSRAEIVALYQAAFEGVVKQDINMHKEVVTMLSENSAVYVADATYTQYDKQGNQLESGPYAITVVLEKRDGEWLNIHTHQSFPPPL